MNLLEAACPNFPKDRKVIHTTNFEKFFKIIDGVLYVPSVKILMSNFLELDRYIESVNAFAKMWDPKENLRDLWDEKNLIKTTGDSEEKCINVIDNILYNVDWKYIACDIETSDVCWDHNELLLIGFAVKPYMSFVVSIFTPRVLEHLQKLFDCKDKIFIWHNGKFDTGRLKYLVNINARVDEDTMLMHYVGINEKRGTHGLKDLGPLYLQAPQWDDELQKFKKYWCAKNKIKLSEFTYDMLPRDTLIPYLHMDCLATYRLWQTFKNLMNPMTFNIYRTLCKASNVFRDIEVRGNYIDRDYLSTLADELDQKIVGAERDLKKAVERYWNPVKYMKESGAKSYPDKFNFKSPKQLKWILSQVTGRNLDKTDKEVLDQLLSDYPEEPFIKAVTDLRKYNKQMDTYVIGLRPMINRDSRIRCSYNLHGTETGRLSSSDPNMQNIPRDKTIKNLFVAAPGRCLVQLDYSQAELRVLAWVSQDEHLKDVYRKGEDLHSAMALKMFGPNFNKEQRVMAKTINFGIPYGRGPGSLCDVFKISYGEAKSLVQDWYAAAPQVETFVKEMRSLPGRGIEYRTIFGRARHFIITNDNANAVENESINFSIQSPASDCTLHSIIEIHDWLKENNIDAYICNTVHDSIIIDCIDNKEVVKKVSEKAKEIMESVPAKYLTHPALDFPFVADVSVGYKWGELE